MDDMQENTKNGEEPEYQKLNIDDTIYKTIISHKFAKRVKWEKPDERKIYSYLPGTLIKLHVKAGDKVKLGQPLLVFEAMKMLNVVKSYKDGVIREIMVKPGDKFPKNRFLLEFE